MNAYDRRGRFGPRPGQRRPDDRPPARLPEGYLAQGYFDRQGHLLPQVVVDWPRGIATALAEARLQTAQLRRFFEEARRIETQLQAGAEFAALRSSRILKMDGYAADAVTKDKAPPLFRQFIGQNLKWASQDRKSFLEGFIPHFESVVAYFPRK